MKSDREKRIKKRSYDKKKFNEQIHRLGINRYKNNLINTSAKKLGELVKTSEDFEGVNIENENKKVRQTSTNIRNVIIPLNHHKPTGKMTPAKKILF